MAAKSVAGATAEDRVVIFDIDWSKRELTLRVCDVKGEVRFCRRVPLATLRVA